MSNVVRISVDSGRAKGNLPNAIRIERDGTLTYADRVYVQGGAFVTSEIARPYGARIWFETDQPIEAYCINDDDQEEDAA